MCTWVRARCNRNGVCMGGENGVIGIAGRSFFSGRSVSRISAFVTAVIPREYIYTLYCALCSLLCISLNELFIS